MGATTPQQQAGGGGGEAAGQRGPGRVRCSPALRRAGSRWLPPAPGVCGAQDSGAGLQRLWWPGRRTGTGDPNPRGGVARAGGAFPPPRARRDRRSPARSPLSVQRPRHLARGRSVERRAGREEETGRKPRARQPRSTKGQERRLPAFPPTPKLFQRTQAYSSRVSAAPSRHQRGGSADKHVPQHTCGGTQAHREGLGLWGGG